MASNVNIGEDMFQQMLTAASAIFKKNWGVVKDYATNELKKLSMDLTLIGTLYASGQIDQDQAQLHFEMQKMSARAVMLTIEGIGLLAVEEAINAALAIVSGTVNKAIGFALL